MISAAEPAIESNRRANKKINQALSAGPRSETSRVNRMKATNKGGEKGSGGEGLFKRTIPAPHYFLVGQYLLNTRLPLHFTAQCFVEYGPREVLFCFLLTLLK